MVHSLGGAAHLISSSLSKPPPLDRLGHLEGKAQLPVPRFQSSSQPPSSRWSSIQPETDTESCWRRAAI